MITLYQSEWCFFSHRVRQVLTEVGADLHDRQRPRGPLRTGPSHGDRRRGGRSGAHRRRQDHRESDEIIAYLRATYPAPEDADAHAALGAWRGAKTVSPRAARRTRPAARAPEEKGFVITGPGQGPQDRRTASQGVRRPASDGPVAAVKALAVDPLAPAAVMFPWPWSRRKTARARRGRRPVGMVWPTANWTSETCRPRSRSVSPRCSRRSGSPRGGHPRGVARPAA